MDSHTSLSPTGANQRCGISLVCVDAFMQIMSILLNVI